MQTLEKLSPPKNQKAHLLFDLINGKFISERLYKYNRFRGIISDLRLDYNVPIHHIDKPFTSAFGKKSYFREHFIRGVDKDDCINIYNKINK